MIKTTGRCRRIDIKLPRLTEKDLGTIEDWAQNLPSSMASTPHFIPGVESSSMWGPFTPRYLHHALHASAGIALKGRASGPHRWRRKTTSRAEKARLSFHGSTDGESLAGLVSTWLYRSTFSPNPSGFLVLFILESMILSSGSILSRPGVEEV